MHDPMLSLRPSHPSQWDPSMPCAKLCTVETLLQQPAAEVHLGKASTIFGDNCGSMNQLALQDP
jgi:hypothetical protein